MKDIKERLEKWRRFAKLNEGTLGTDEIKTLAQELGYPDGHLLEDNTYDLECAKIIIKELKIALKQLVSQNDKTMICAYDFDSADYMLDIQSTLNFIGVLHG